jgi:hypothetical protein
MSFLSFIGVLTAVSHAVDFPEWTRGLEVPADTPRAPYRFRQQVYSQLAEIVRERPGVVEAFPVGDTVERRPIWAFRVSSPTDEPKVKVLVFGGIHALEWISTEVATTFLLEMAEAPPPGVELVVIPLVNVDGRDNVERDLVAGQNVYRRGNANKVDLNRDFEVNREAKAIWRHLVPAYYGTSPAPLSQPESQALDRLAGEERFDVSVSLHSFGGFLYYPWGGLWKRPPDATLFEELGAVMQGGQGAHSYTVKQLCHWGFLFRIHGAELDHFYGKYGTLSFLVELTRSGLEPMRPNTWRDYFRWYNPRDPSKTIESGVGALRALVRYRELADVVARRSGAHDPGSRVSPR